LTTVIVRSEGRADEEIPLGHVVHFAPGDAAGAVVRNESVRVRSDGSVVVERVVLWPEAVDRRGPPRVGLAERFQNFMRGSW